MGGQGTAKGTALKLVVVPQSSGAGGLRRKLLQLLHEGPRCGLLPLHSLLRQLSLVG
jgi:hypothetical protein